MELFDFEFYSVRPDTYPSGGDVYRLGKGHQFATKPILPIQRTFVVEFEEGLKWCQNEAGVYVSSITPKRNILKLIEFYEEHQQWKRFEFPHEIYGTLTVSFADPLAVPKARRGGSGWTEGFELKVIEHP